MWNTHAAYVDNRSSITYLIHNYPVCVGTHRNGVPPLRFSSCFFSNGVCLTLGVFLRLLTLHNKFFLAKLCSGKQYTKLRKNDMHLGEHGPRVSCVASVHAVLPSRLCITDSHTARFLFSRFLQRTDVSQGN